jgi:hypothetical protein
LGQLVGMRHLISGDDWAMAGAAIAPAAVPAPATPAAFRNLRRSMLAMSADLLEGTRERLVTRGAAEIPARHAPLGVAC